MVDISYNGRSCSFEIEVVSYIKKPTISKKSFVYNGSAQGLSIANNPAYRVLGKTKATAADTYTAKVTCLDGYRFSTGEKSMTVTWTIAKASIANANVNLKSSSAPFTGQTQKGVVKSVVLGKKTLSSTADYKVSAKSGINVDSYVVTVTGTGNYKGSAKATFKITQAKNSATVAKTSVAKTFKVSTLKAKAQTVALPKVTKKFGKAVWKVKTSDKKKVLSLKGDKVNVKKGARAGTYTIKVYAAVAKTANYTAATTKVVTVKVTVK